MFYFEKKFYLADVIAIYMMIVADAITTKADVIAFTLFMVLADVIANEWQIL